MKITAAIERGAATRPWNFAPGPAMLPAEVLAEIRAELEDYAGTGVSPLELGHRSDAFRALAQRTEESLRELMAIPADYAVLFLHGGATLQFGMVPLNLARQGTAGYLITGQWSAKAYAEAAGIGRAHAVWDGRAEGYLRLPAHAEWHLPRDCSYLHYTVNETIAGVEFHALPETGDLPLVADMTSMILSRPVDVRRHALIYAATQKNLGIAGLTVVILRPELLPEQTAGLPSMLDYRAHMAAASLLNTPPVFAWYVAGKMLDWIRAQGGVAALAARNRRKAQMVYAALDGSGFYCNAVHKSCRSWMNVPFRLHEAALEPLFLREAEAAGLRNLAGHRSAGGLRASLYNAMPEAGAAALAAFLRDFERRHG